MEKTIYIKGHKVKHNDDVRGGIDYLSYDLDEQESRVFFDQAKAKKFAEFEDDHEGQYTLTYDYNGAYILSRRDH